MDKTAQAECVLTIHEVADYQKWKGIFDAAASIRHTAGEIDYQLLASSSNERQIVHFSRWRSLEAAQLFFETAFKPLAADQVICSVALAF